MGFLVFYSCFSMILWSFLGFSEVFYGFARVLSSKMFMCLVFVACFLKLCNWLQEKCVWLVIGRFLAAWFFALHTVL